jgi:selenocysteine lyase/cysteine desulfurase
LTGSPVSPFAPSDIPISAFVKNFEFVGTIDNAPYLCIPAAIEWRESIGGEKAIRDYCGNLARDGTKMVAEMLGTEILENSTQTLTQCCMANVRLPLDAAKLTELAAQAGVGEDAVAMLVRDWISRTLVNDYDTFIATMWYSGAWWSRFSGQVYLEIGDLEWAGEVLAKVCERVAKGEWLGGASKL